MQLPLLIRACCIGISIDSRSNVEVKIGGNVFQLPFIKIIILRKAANNAAFFDTYEIVLYIRLLYCSSDCKIVAIFFASKGEIVLCLIKGKGSAISLYEDVVDIVCRQIRSSFVKWLVFCYFKEVESGAREVLPFRFRAFNEIC